MNPTKESRRKRRELREECLRAYHAGDPIGDVGIRKLAARSEPLPAGMDERLSHLRSYVDRAGEDLIGVTEAASRLGVSRTTVYDWVARNTLIAWRSTQHRLNIPAGQILGLGRVRDGLAAVVDVVGEPELAWAFLSQDWPFEDEVARPIERLRSGRLDEVLSAATGFGSTFT